MSLQFFFKSTKWKHVQFFSNLRHFCSFETSSRIWFWPISVLGDKGGVYYLMKLNITWFIYKLDNFILYGWICSCDEILPESRVQLCRRRCVLRDCPAITRAPAVTSHHCREAPSISLLPSILKRPYVLLYKPGFGLVHAWTQGCKACVRAKPAQCSHHCLHRAGLRQSAESMDS